MRIEDVAILTGGYMIHGVKKGEEWKYKVLTPAQRYEKLLSAAENEAHRTRLKEEYANGVGHLVKWLESKGLNLEEIASRVNEKHSL